MIIKPVIIKALLFIGLTIRGHHYFYRIILNSNKRYIVEIIGLGGKTTLLKELKKRRLFKLKKIKPNYSEIELRREEISNQIVEKKLFYSAVKIVLESGSFYYQIQRILEKLILYSKYSTDFSIITDEGLIKGNLKLINGLVLRGDSSLKRYLSRFLFIILLPDIELVIERYINRNSTPSYNKEKLRNYIYEEYNNTSIFLNYLESNHFPFILIKDNDSNSVDKVIDFLMKFN